MRLIFFWLYIICLIFLIVQIFFDFPQMLLNIVFGILFIINIIIIITIKDNNISK